jgi:polyhydroxybutyrate depolymerase
MKKNTVLTALLMVMSFLAGYSQQWDTAHITAGNSQRQYKTYHHQSGQQQMKVVLMLHGLGGSMNDVDLTSWKAIADTANMLLVSPQALDYTVPLAGNIGACWNSGIVLENTPLGTLTLNPDVDDAGFLKSLIDTVKSRFSVDGDKIYVCGFSNGGFMTQRLICEAPGQFRAAASASGTRALAIQNCAGKTIPMAHFHGTDDGVVTWQGVFNSGIITAQAGISVDSLMHYWQNRHQSVYFDSINFGSAADPVWMTHYRYAHNGRERTALYKIHNGTHSWYNYANTNNKFDMALEMWKFFLNQDDASLSIAAHKEIQFSIYPNPSGDQLYISTDQKDWKQYRITDFMGRTLQQAAFHNAVIDIATLAAGSYFLTLTNENGLNYSTRFIKKPS